MSSSSVAAGCVTLGLVQMRCVPDRDENLASALSRIAVAAGQGAQVVCLPELFCSQYFCQEQDPAHFDLAEPVPGPTTEVLASAAARHGVVVVGSVFERRMPGVYHNTAVVLDADGTLAGTYRKMHVPDDPLYYEKFYFSPGDLGVQVVPTTFGAIAPLVCWDQWFPEAARAAALAGAEFLVYPSAIGWHPSEKAQHGGRQMEAWQTVQRSHAIANGVFVAAINRTGVERPLEASPSRPADYRGLEFWGRSFVADPFGGLLCEAGAGEETVFATCDRAEIERIRRDWPFLRDRRPEAYGALSTRGTG